MKSSLILILALALAPSTFAQQPTSQAAITPVNASTVNGVGPGYYPRLGTGLTLNVGPGTANCGGIVNYAGGTFTMTPNATNYVYLNLTSSCGVTVNTTGFGNNIPIATVVTSASSVSSITDVRTMFGAGQAGAAGAGSFTIVNGVYHYKDVVAYTHYTAGPTGTVEIALPSAFIPGRDTAIDMTINGFSWPWGAWTIQVGGFPGFVQCSPGPNSWCGASASITGAFPYGYVRLAWDTSLSRFVVLLGTPTTAWDDLMVEVSDVTPNSGVSGAGFGTGWSIAILSSENSIINVNKVVNAPAYASVGPVPAEGDRSTGNGGESSVSLEVEGSALGVPLFIGVNSAVYHYRDVISAYSWASPGELEIALPSAGVVNGMTGEINMTIEGYDHNVKSAWQVMVGGLAGFPTSDAWGECSVVVSGNPPFGSVRLAYDTSLSRYVVLLGTTSTAWAYSWAEVADFVVGYQDQSNWGNGWKIASLNSEVNLSNIVTPSAMWQTGQTVAASHCGSLPGAAGCAVVEVNGAGKHYLPYW